MRIRREANRLGSDLAFSGFGSFLSTTSHGPVVTSASDRPRRRRKQGRLLAVIAFGWFLTLGVRFLLPALLPQIKAAFDIGNTTAGLAITAIWFGYGLMQFPAGVLVDRLGARTLLSLSLALAAVCLGIIGAAPVYVLFLAACGLLGLATGLFGTSRGIALSHFFQSNRGRAFGVALGAGSVGSAVLPFLSTAVEGALGWRVAVGLTVPLFALTALATWGIVPAGSETTSSSADVPFREVLGTLRAGFANRAIVIGVVGYTCMLFTLQGLTGFLPTYLIQAKGLSQQTASGLFALLFLGGAASQFVGGSAADRFGTRPVELAIAGVGVVTLALLPVVDGVLPLALLVVVMSSRIASASVMNPYIIDAVPDEATGTGWGLLRTAFFSIGATGSTVVGVMSDAGLFDEAFYLLAGVTAAATVLFVFLPRRRPES